MSLLGAEKKAGREDPVSQSGIVAISLTKSFPDFDAVAAFRQISPDGQGFILDGCSPEKNADRYVYVGVGECDRLLIGAAFPAGEVDPAAALRAELGRREVDNEKYGLSLPQQPFITGAIGYFAYESIRHFEPSVGDLPCDPMGLPEAAFFLPAKYLVYDRFERKLTAVVTVRSDLFNEATESAAQDEAEQMISSVEVGLSSGARSARTRVQVHSGDSKTLLGTDSRNGSRYESLVSNAKYEIERGELIQVVLSQRSVRHTEASPLEIFESLADLNPSPYMFMLNFGDFAVVGASPELMVRARGSEVSMHPIAGTRPRGASAAEDAALEAELITSEKERAEHVMLVDLARNDLGRVSVPGTVQVDSFMATERYSHVMHLVSRVRGRLSKGEDGLNAFVAGFPLGTLTGAPRLRAMELIAELEDEGRGPYCGGVGWFDAGGDVDTGTIIRCVTMKNGEAHVQAGGGIVFDSDPMWEYRESMNKMAAQLEAIDIAESLTINGQLISGEVTG